MIIPDINILIYAINSDNIYHNKAKKWLEEVFSGNEPVGFTWIVIIGFLRIITNSRIMPNALPPEVAYGIIDEWLDLPVSHIINPTNEHWKIMKEILLPLGTAGNLTSDAHLAAFALEHNACLYTTDNDFDRFRLLRHKNPLSDGKGD